MNPFKSLYSRLKEFAGAFRSRTRISVTRAFTFSKKWLLGPAAIVVVSACVWSFIEYGDSLVSFWDSLRIQENDRESASTTIRNIGLVVAGLFALGFAVWRSIVAQKQANAALRQSEVAQQGLLNERYQKGAEMLGNEVLAVRLGGIYALRSLAEEHPEQYHIQVTELLCAFVRNPTHRGVERENPAALVGTTRQAPPIREDIQVTISTIGNRSAVGLALEKRTEKFRLDLSRADLRGAHLPDVNLASANLGGTDMRGTYFNGANLSQVYLQGAKLERANLIHADLSGAIIGSADLQSVIAQVTDFSGANFIGANLSGADLRWANLSRASLGISNLSNAELEGANLSGVIFGTGTRTTLSTPPTSEEVFARLTQRQLDVACAHSYDPPQITEGTLDIETGEPLVWRGMPCAVNSSP